MDRTITDLRMRARALDEAADHLTRRINTIAWHGFAADAMRHRAAGAIAELRESSRRHAAAADAVDRHRRAALANPAGQLAYTALGMVEDLGSAVGHLL